MIYTKLGEKQIRRRFSLFLAFAFSWELCKNLVDRCNIPQRYIFHSDATWSLSVIVKISAFWRQHKSRCLGPESRQTVGTEAVHWAVCEHCKAVHTPGRDLCVDDSMLLFKGRLGFKQYIKTKRARFGIKLFQLCTKSGIFWDFLIYSGDMTKELEMDGAFLIMECIPITLIEPYVNKGF